MYVEVSWIVAAIGWVGLCSRSHGFGTSGDDFRLEMETPPVRHLKFDNRGFLSVRPLPLHISHNPRQTAAHPVRWGSSA
jgi:hypothetical protein